MRLILSVLVILLVCQLVTPDADDEESFRSKRQLNSLPLVYPYGGTYKLLIGLAAPIQNDENIALLFAANFQYQYAQFTNISQLSQYYIIKDISREEREAELTWRKDERLVFYRSLAEILTSKGFNGPDCVLRAICEVAQFPVEDEGLVGKIIHILLTPDYGKTPFDDVDRFDWEETMAPYRDAAVAGRQMFSCTSIYPGCPEGEGILELITILRDE